MQAEPEQPEAPVAGDVSEYADREFGTRKVAGWKAWLIPIIAAAWSLFQLSLPKLLLLNTQYVRCIHLAFAFALVYLSFPTFRSKRMIRWLKKGPSWLGVLYRRDRLTAWDLIWAVGAAAVALYLMLDYEGIAERIGTPIARDLVIGVILILLLLDAARRALGLALPVIAGSFILYSFFSQQIGEFLGLDMLAFKNATLSKVVTKLCLTSEGIYGVPLDVSASVVFLFVLFGAMLEKGGGGQYFIQLAFSLLGRFKGGPAKAAVLASGLTGMVNGSSIANTVTTGTFTIPLMKKAGFSGVKAGAVEVAASTNGQLMPPIMGAAAFIMAEYCNLTYFEVVKAAFVPAVISYIALIYITHLEASKLDLRGVPKDQLPSFWPTFLGGIHFLIPLGFLIYQLVVLRSSASLSAFYAIMALAVLILVKSLVSAVKTGRSIGAGLKVGGLQLWESLVAGGRNMMGIGVAVAAAGIIVGIVTLGLGNVITDLIDILSMGNLLLMLLITAVVSLILGMGLPTTANYIVMASLTAPAILVLGADAGLEIPVIAAHLFVFYFGILSDDTPPVGLSAYAAAAISGEDPIKTGIQGFKYDIRTAILPFMFIFNSQLLLIGVESWWGFLVVFTTGLAGMFAFAALTQGWFLIKNRFYEGFLLALAALILFRPDLGESLLLIPRNYWYGIGLAIIGGVYGLQRWRGRRQIAK